jgi:hypothetical protein
MGDRKSRVLRGTLDLMGASETMRCARFQFPTRIERRRIEREIESWKQVVGSVKRFLAPSKLGGADVPDTDFVEPLRGVV